MHLPPLDRELLSGQARKNGRTFGRDAQTFIYVGTRVDEEIFFHTFLLGEKKWLLPYHDLRERERETLHKALFALSAHLGEKVGFEWYAMQYALVGPWIHRKEKFLMQKTMMRKTG